MESNPVNRKAIALLILVFVLGIALGAVGHMLLDRSVLASRPRGQRGPGAMNRLTQELILTPGQQQGVAASLAETQRRYDAIREQMGPQFDAARDQGRDQIRQILTPEQRPKFEDFLHRLDEERQKRGPRYGAPRP